ncbi:MAG TPA: IlvD/Edd family dehydratase [Luteitalea sp.]|nr:IlvD/Edd family dehydratase [Luteitalea sp.]
MSNEKKQRRSAGWFSGTDRNTFIHRSWMKNQGHPDHVFDGRPIIGICNTFSDLTPCNAHFRELAEHVKHGVYEAGGFPLEFPVMSLGETQLRPTAMLFRNLASMDVEESIRGNPIDGVVLLVGCDKTTPACVMGAASVDLPTIVLSGGPMLNGKFRGRDIGSGTHVWKFSEDVRCGVMPLADFTDAEAGMSRSAGHCMTMGTASTMACLVEALGIALPTNAAIPAVDARRSRLAHLVGNRIVGMVEEDLRLSKVLTREAFENAVHAVNAVGGSTNAVIHLLAIAGRIGVPFTLEDWDRLGREVSCLVNLMPSGQYLMEDFYYAGGLPAVLRALGDVIHRDVLTVSGRTMGEQIADAECYNADVIRSVDSPVVPDSGIAVLRGNLCPDGAIVKPAAASPRLLQHTGRAVVFKDIDDFHARIDDESLDVDHTCVLVLKHCGPRGYPGMPEVGNMPLPPKVLREGVSDMVRISDARMSGTAYGTVILHISPEAALGGTLALVQNGDQIALDVPARTLNLLVDDAELARRRAAWQPPAPPTARGYVKLYVDHVLQAHEGADLDFLRGGSGSAIPRHSH